jgi:hypothetical protein
LAQVSAGLRKASRQLRPGSLRVPPLSLRLVTWQRMSFSDPLTCASLEGGAPETCGQNGLIIKVRHYPPGTSKWNKIEHRMFCDITKTGTAIRGSFGREILAP